MEDLVYMKRAWRHGAEILPGIQDSNITVVWGDRRCFTRLHIHNGEGALCGRQPAQQDLWGKFSYRPIPPYCTYSSCRSEIMHDDEKGLIRSIRITFYHLHYELPCKFLWCEV
jgi:hypothetical protein